MKLLNILFFATALSLTSCAGMNKKKCASSCDKKQCKMEKTAKKTCCAKKQCKIKGGCKSKKS